MNKNRITFAIVASGVFLVLIILLVSFLTRRSSTSKEVQITPTGQPGPTLIRSNDGSYITSYITSPDSLQVVSTNPVDKASNVSTNTKIIVQFNKPFKEGDIIFSIDPAASYSLEAENKTLTVTFTQSLAGHTVYTFKVDPKESFPHTYSFTTEGTGPILQPDTRPEGAAQIEDDFNKSNNPDIYVANRCPYEQAAFSIVAVYNNDTRTFNFVVTAKNNDRQKAKDAVTQWLQSIGLSFDAISQLTISYQ